MEDLTPSSDAVSVALESGSEEAWAWLAQQLAQTTDLATMVRIALAFREAGRGEHLPLVVAKLALPAPRGHRGRLVYACDEVDCTPYFSLFVSLALHDTYHTSWCASGVVRKMHLAAVPGAELEQALRDVEHFVCTQGTSDNTDFARQLLAFLQKHDRRRRKKS